MALAKVPLLSFTCAATSGSMSVKNGDILMLEWFVVSCRFARLTGSPCPAILLMCGFLSAIYVSINTNRKSGVTSYVIIG